MYSDVVLGVDHYLFEEALEIRKDDKRLLLDTELAAEDWQALVGVYKKKVQEALCHPFPQDVNDQLWGAVGAVFGSWQSTRATVYRRINDISDARGTPAHLPRQAEGRVGEEWGSKGR